MCRGLMRKNTALSTGVDEEMMVKAMIIEVEKRGAAGGRSSEATYLPSAAGPFPVRVVQDQGLRQRWTSSPKWRW